MSRKFMTASVERLKVGMILGQTIFDDQGNILLGEGMSLKELYIKKLKDHGIIKVNIIRNQDKKEKYIDLEDDVHIDKDELSEVRFEAKELVKDTMKRLYLNDSTSIENLMAVVNRIIDLLLDNKEISINLNTLRTLDDYTFEHSVNVCILSLVMGISMNLKEEDLKELGIGALLHDIGKLLVPSEILNKPGPLSTEEYSIVKNHTTFGYDFLMKNKIVSKAAAEVALSHHERPDGNGYPRSKSSDEIHIFSRIVALADVFDALTSDRAYKKKIHPCRAMEYIIEMSSSQFDKKIVDSFISSIGVYPTGCFVRLNTSELGMVTKTNYLYPNKPIVRIVVDNNGQKVSDHLEVDIQKNPSIFISELVPVNAHAL